MKKYKWRAGDALALAEFSAFLADFNDGKIKPFTKSEAEPCECVPLASVCAWRE